MEKSRIAPITFYLIPLLIFTVFSTACDTKEKQQKIDRYQLVNRHNVHLDRPDTLGSLSVGNGEFAYTADITGMQTFPEAYEQGVPLGTQSQWGWHSFPNDSNYTLEDVLVNYKSCNPDSVSYAIQPKSGRAERAANWLRSNPQRLHLGMIGLEMIKSNGEIVQLGDIANANQLLNLWTGKIESHFEIEGVPVFVETVAHQDKDLVSFKIISPLIYSDQLRLMIRFPFANDCSFCPGYEWNNEDLHRSEIIEQGDHNISIQRTLDATNYFVDVAWNGNGKITSPQIHYFELSPDKNLESLEVSVSFKQQNALKSLPTFAETNENSSKQWESFWMSGGTIDFSACTDPQASELERRVILSLYLTKIQCSGSMPPQETGLTYNSWYGKFHLEMHWWHAVHFALWGRPELLENSMNWYFDNLENARMIANRQGYEGVRWQKMTSIDGKSSPSNVGEFLVWQQPHIIYFSELLYRSNPSKETLEKYRALVFETADFMASFAQRNEQDGKYHLCPPLIPAQEHFKATETSDPAFELSYWYWGLQTAQTWRERLGQDKNEKWQQVLDNLAPIPSDTSDYLPTAEATDAFTNFDKRRDHPIVVGAYGFLPNDRIDMRKMEHTFDNVMHEWNWQSTWGWDYPLLAMSATRLGKPEDAIKALLTDTQKNTYLVNGHNFQTNRLTIYLPGNGGLLAAVAMMAAGSENTQVFNPGFPKNGQWDVKWEGLLPAF